jgi:hypothetical protein
MTWFLSVGLASQWRGIVRLYEGYPLQAVYKSRRRDAPGVRWHQERLDTLRPPPESVTGRSPADVEAALRSKLAGGRGRVQPSPSSAYYRYPTRDHRADVLPTRLGNILLAGEMYSTDRYGIDCIIFWPRLWPLLPEQFQRDYEEFLITYEFPLVVSFLAAVTGLILGAVTVASRQPTSVFLAVFLGGFSLAYGAYRFSLASAEELAEQQRTAFDLYRDRLLEAWPTVLDIRDEKVAFALIRNFVVDNREASWSRSQVEHHRRRVRRSSTGPPMGQR